MKSAVIFLAALVAASSAYGQGNETRLLPPYQKIHLQNGMTLLLMEQHEVPITSFNVIVRTGSVADPKGKEGLASLTAELLRKGTATRPADRIADGLDFIGAEFDVEASQDFTTVSAEFLTKDLGQGLDLLAEMLIEPSFPQAEFDKLVQQRISGIRSAKDQASGVIARYFNAFLYGSHPYARPVGGDETSLAAIRREDVTAFHHTYYIPANIVIAGAGDFEVAAMRRLLEQRFGSWPAKTPPRIELPRVEIPAGRRALLVDKPDSTQTYFYIGHTGISRTHPDRVAIAVINTLFGGRFTSRLNTALRVDSGLTYGASSRFDQRSQTGPFFISSYTRNETTEQAIATALEVLQTLHQEGVTASELESVKTYLKGQFPPTVETSDRLAATIAQLEFYGLDSTDIDSYYEKIDAVNIDRAQRIISMYFPLQEWSMVLVGKAAEIHSAVSKYAPALTIRSINDSGF
jgi:predicted Zn-dependent peptidase